MIFMVKVGPNYGVQFYKGLYVIKIFFRTAMLNMWYDCEIILLQKGHNIEHENIQKKMKFIR